MPASPKVDPRRQLPALGRLLDDPEVMVLVGRFGREATAAMLRQELERRRADDNPPTSDLVEAVRSGLADHFHGSTRRVLNATGVLLHTNLGRAPLPDDLAARAASLAAGYCDLEVDLPTNRRVDRISRVAARLCALTDAKAALVTNNAAAALVLVIAALAKDREVVISRGELVEIGGSFRIGEIIAAAGARLVEVGSTNRTRIDDYANAIGPQTGLLLQVHRSNFAVSGFVDQPALGELVALARRSGLPLVVDEGSGHLTPAAGLPALAAKATVARLIEHGADLVVFSGDKLLGGPQAGVLVGTSELVHRCRHHPLYRALRAGKLVLVTLELVLDRRLRGDCGPRELLATSERLLQRALQLARRSRGAVALGRAEFGGGAGAPEAIPGPVVALPGGDALASRLRCGTPGVVGYLRDGLLILDLRTINTDDDEALAQACEMARNRPADAEVG